MDAPCIVSDYHIPLKVTDSEKIQNSEVWEIFARKLVCFSITFEITFLFFSPHSNCLNDHNRSGCCSTNNYLVKFTAKIPDSGNTRFAC